MKKILKKRLGIFGGAFDPIHLGHIIPVTEITKKHKLDIVHFLPTNISSSSKIISASTSNRVKMLHQALSDYENYIIDEREIIRGGKSYTIDTINSISDEYKNYKLYLIIGFDNLSSILQWKNFLQILEKCNIIVSRRRIFNQNNHKMSDDLNNIDKELMNCISSDLVRFHNQSYGKIYIEATSILNISSSEVRQKLKQNQPVSDLIPQKLNKWLLEHKVY
ncbi:MAG: nicotinate (nicotinamide) nucleotide adenylyltransferase [Pelagibacterales bacterium]|nr:nicotinate (nicotinamide) nucleotide adenylyltransferase [Pelagibacterales bacterium]